MSKEQSSMKCRHCSHYDFSCTWCYEQKQVHYPLDEACERVRQTRINKEMTYEERLKMLKLRYGV